MSVCTLSTLHKRHRNIRQVERKLSASWIAHRAAVLPGYQHCGSSPNTVALDKCMEAVNASIVVHVSCTLGVQLPQALVVAAIT